MNTQALAVRNSRELQAEGIGLQELKILLAVEGNKLSLTPEQLKEWRKAIRSGQVLGSIRSYLGFEKPTDYLDAMIDIQEVQLAQLPRYKDFKLDRSKLVYRGNTDLLKYALRHGLVLAPMLKIYPTFISQSNPDRSYLNAANSESNWWFSNFYFSSNKCLSRYYKSCYKWRSHGLERVELEPENKMSDLMGTAELVFVGYYNANSKVRDLSLTPIEQIRKIEGRAATLSESLLLLCLFNNVFKLRSNSSEKVYFPLHENGYIEFSGGDPECGMGIDIFPTDDLSKQLRKESLLKLSFPFII